MTRMLTERRPLNADDRMASLESELAILTRRLTPSEARLDALVRLSSDWHREFDASLRLIHCRGGGDAAGEDLARLLV